MKLTLNPEQELTLFVDRYYEHRDKELAELKKLSGYILQTDEKFKKFPQARKFLKEQEECWHPYSLEMIAKKKEIKKGHFAYAKEFFLELSPDKDMSLEIQRKQESLIAGLESWYERNREVVVGVNSLILLLKNQQPRVVTEVSELDHYEPSWLESTLDDERFMREYRLMADLKYHNYAGLWRFTQAPVEGIESEAFYSGVADFSICMLEGIKELEQDLKKERQLRIA